ncbi:MAG TPA: HlyD family efflux transporter periplasmic adaptor subunit [Gammaproteobacteria bacterium]|nr:HlyD family efflux transporter periplasmic adaptor subunit [Gammaproteobacteria bacterium]
MDDAALFRREAIAHRGDSLFGGVALLRPASFALATALALGASTALTALVLLGSYAPRETVAGYLTPAPGLVKILAPQSGIIESTPFREGDSVAAGDALFVVLTSRHDAARSDVDARLLEQLGIERLALQAQRDRQLELDGMALAAAAQDVVAAKAQLTLLERQRMGFDERVSRRELEVARLAPVVGSGHVPAARLEEARAALLEARLARQEMDREAAALEALLETRLRERASLPARHALRLGQLDQAISVVDQRIAELGLQRGYTLTAPVAGYIGSLLAFPGMGVVPGRALAALIPEHAQLRAELLVPARNAGLLKTGQTVRLRYDAWPHTRFGLHEGIVTAIGRSILMPEEMHGPHRLPGPAYRVEVRLPAQSIISDGRAWPLKAGMTLEADIVRERRRIVEWLFEPVVAALQRAR